MKRAVDVEAAFAAALRARVEEVGATRTALASLLFERARLEGDLHEARARVARNHAAVLAASRAGDAAEERRQRSSLDAAHAALTQIESELDRCKTDLRHAEWELAEAHRAAADLRLEARAARLITRAAAHRDARRAHHRRWAAEIAPTLDKARAQIELLEADLEIDH